MTCAFEVKCKKSPQIVPMCRQFLTGKHDANSLNIWCICYYYTHNVVRSWGFVGGWKAAANNRKLTNDFTTPVSSKKPRAASSRLTTRWGKFSFIQHRIYDTTPSPLYTYTREPSQRLRQLGHLATATHPLCLPVTKYKFFPAHRRP